MAEPELIDVGGRRMALARDGTGDPAVILISGLGLDMRLWRDVFPRVASFTTVCTFDHPGVGRSDPRPASFGVRQGIDDWRRLLISAGLSTRSVIAAHSAHGQIARIFAAQYPEMVAGLVLVDATNEAMVERLRGVLSHEGHAAYAATWSGPFYDEFFALIGRDLPQGLPVTVLTRGLPDARFVPAPELTVERWEPIYRELQRDLATRLGATHRVVGGSRHLMPRDQPQAVVEAIREMVERIRGVSVETSSAE